MIYSTSMLMMVCLVSVAGDDIAIGLTIRDNSSMASGATSVIPDDATSVGFSTPRYPTPYRHPCRPRTTTVSLTTHHSTSRASPEMTITPMTARILRMKLLDNDEFGAIPTNRAPRKENDSDFLRERYSDIRCSPQNRVASTDLMIGSRIAARRPCFTIPTTMALGLRR